MHEAAHFRIHSNKGVNDLIGEVLLAWPLTITLYGYRKMHAAHHRYLNTGKDPDWVQDAGRSEFSFPKTHKQLFWICFKYGTGFYAIKELVNASGYNEKVPLQINLPRVSLYLLTISASIYFNFWLEIVLFWIVPLLTSFFFFCCTSEP